MVENAGQKKKKKSEKSFTLERMKRKRTSTNLAGDGPSDAFMNEVCTETILSFGK